MRTWLYVFLAVALDGCAALLAGLIPERQLERAREPLVGFAAGVLIGTALLDMLPEALARLPSAVVLGTVVATLAAMVFLEWTIGHRVTGDTETRRLAPVLLGADGLHNAADGGAIAAAFLASPRLGVIAAAAVIVHEVPEELADYVVLREAGMSRSRALVAMTGVQLTAAVGAVLTLIGARTWTQIAPFVLALAAGTFLHIAEVDLVPTVIGEGPSRQRRVEAVLAFLLGLAAVVAVTFLAGPGCMDVIDVEARAARVRERLRRVASSVPALQYAMTDRTRLRFEHATGLMDVGSGTRAAADTLFMAASCTKVVTAAAVLDLASAGRLALDAPLAEYCADQPYGREVTLRQLLTHTAGIPNPVPLNWLHRIEDTTFDEDRALVAALHANAHLRSPPGTRYLYSNLGYWLLGKVIERAAGVAYVRYVENAVLGPLGVPRGGLTFAVEDSKCLARGYERAWSPLGVFARLAVRAYLRDGRDGPWLRFARVAMNGPSYGGLFATARGFCAFLRGALARRSNAALGWRAGTLTGISYLGKPGGGPGFCGNVRIYPSLGVGTAWFANRMFVSERKIIAFTDAIDERWLA